MEIIEIDEVEVIEQETQSENTYKEEPLPQKKRKGFGKKVLAVLLALCLAAGAGFGGGFLAAYYVFDGGSFIGSSNPITITPTDQVDTAEAVAAKVIPSVVGISTTTEVIRENLFGMQSGQRIQGVGTGFIVSEDGFIVTNSHVVGDGSAETIIVQLTDGREMEGTVLWSDTILDLAVVKIDAQNLTAAELGDSDSVNIGAYAVAIGNPFGLAFDRSVTQGVISGLDRTITVGGTGQGVTMEGLMQTDASINTGNSGGPLLNSTGQVIGINSAKAATGEGLGFAIPINTAKPIVEEVMETGTFKKAYIGIGGGDVELYLQYYPDADLGTNRGVFVSQIYQRSPADMAGLKQGDVIVALDDITIKTMNQLTRELFSFEPGDAVNLIVYRDGKRLEVLVTLGTMPQQ